MRTYKSFDIAYGRYHDEGMMTVTFNDCPDCGESMTDCYSGRGCERFGNVRHKLPGQSSGPQSPADALELALWLAIVTPDSSFVIACEQMAEQIIAGGNISDIEIAGAKRRASERAGL